MDDLDLGQTLRGFAAGQKVFGRYTLVRLLGRGGMGVVWLARDEKLEQDIALKFLPEMIAHDPVAVNDLKRETRRSLQLTHPHIVRIHDFVEDSRLAAVSMEFVDGASLSLRRLEQPGQVFEPSQLQGWVQQLCEALEYAHGKAKIVHRDLKPANLMVDANGDLKVADFGISATLSDTTTRVSKQASSSGTPVYMSPQQMMGEKPAATDDIYSLGATLYELLTGKPPFYSGNILLQVQNKVPPSIAARREELGVTVAGAGGPGIPTAWEEAIAACLAKQPQDRPQSAAEVWRRLGGGAVAGSEEREASRAEPEQSEPSIPSTSSREPTPRRPRSRLPLVFALAATVALGGWYFGIEIPAERRQVEQQRQVEIARQEEQRKASERLVEQKRQAEIAELEAARREAEMRAEAEAKERARLEAEAQRLCAEQAAAARKAEQDRLAAEAAARAERERQERVVAEQVVIARAEQAHREVAERAEEASRAAAAKTERPKIGQRWTVPGLSLVLIPIPVGSFSMGSTSGESEEDERPVTNVRITRPFWIGRTEVTQTQWENIMGSTPSYFKGGDLPVNGVSYDDAMEFCRKLTERERTAWRLPEGYVFTLPTEAQWEYTCRAGTKGDRAGDLSAMAWYGENYGKTTHAVGQKQPNAWGVCDMYGNVWEWCSDWIGPYCGGGATDPTGPSSGLKRVARGNGWFGSAEGCRSPNRSSFDPTYRGHLGFRVTLVSQGPQ